MAHWFLLGFAIASIPLYIFGIIGNTMVIRIVHKTREMHTTTNYLLANLAVSDAIAIFTIPMYFLHDGVFGPSLKNFTKFSCKFAVIGDIATISSTSTLTVIAVERYHAILKPFSSNLRLNEENIKKAIVLIWTLSIAVGFPGFFLNVWNNERAVCDGPWGSKPNLASKIYMIVNLLFTTYIPMFVFLFCYGSLIKGLYFSNEICAESTNEDNSEKKKLLITFILATSGFILGYGPLTVFYTMISFGKRIDPCLFEKLRVGGFFSFLISLCLNPVLYAFRSSSFKEGFKRKFQPCYSQTVEHNAN
ncbi:substance-P receptor-like [Acropora millepora]|uniref:substance-P receptor-like n=1 Tax=Acropora millepora TaxID=45264 RepID=UPI001CF39BC6|nr:substance-P receptor-like [Acropora millepora]